MPSVSVPCSLGGPGGGAASLHGSDGAGVITVGVAGAGACSRPVAPPRIKHKSGNVSV